MKKNKTPLAGIYMKESYIRHSNKPRISCTPKDLSSIHACIRMTILVKYFDYIESSFCPTHYYNRHSITKRDRRTEICIHTRETQSIIFVNEFSGV